MTSCTVSNYLFIAKCGYIFLGASYHLIPLCLFKLKLMRHKTNEFFCPKHTGDLSHLSFGPNPPFLQVLIPGTSVTLTKGIGGLTKSYKKASKSPFLLDQFA